MGYFKKITMKKFLVKSAWINNHETLGRVLGLLVTEYRETAPCNYGYSLDEKFDEVIIVPTHYPKAIGAISKMDKIGAKDLWKMSEFGGIAEITLNMDDFCENSCYQNEWHREVLFHTHKDLI